MSCARSRGQGCRALIAFVLVASLTGCRSVRRQPSILLFVFDTTRMDAVSAYGVVSNTTPTLDALASGGLRYTRAYAQAPWTLPSHTTLFTGLLPSQHGVGWQNVRASNDLTMLAERLHDAGYETVGVSENIWISETFNMVQGFSRFVNADSRTNDVAAFIQEWVRDRPPGRPFFLFVNVMNAHHPYQANHPDGQAPHSPKLDIGPPQSRFFCSRQYERGLDVLRKRYLGAVAAADEKLGDVVSILRRSGLADGMITIVTADHGEHFGEHGLVSHQFSVHEEVLRVPLVVQGLGGVTPAVITTPVELADIVPTVLGWVGLRTPPRLAGQPLPTRPGSTRSSVIVAEFNDTPAREVGTGSLVGNVLLLGATELRRHCDRQQRVFGDMRALMRYPFKLVWYADYPAELYDVSSDPGENRDVASQHPTLVSQLTGKLMRIVSSRAQPPSTGAASSRDIPPDVVERLRALGYVGPSEPPDR